MTRDIAEFGVRDPGVEYRPRPGGYVVLCNEASDIAVIAEQGGLFLPGGGQEPNESPEAAALRETREECGLIVRLNGLIGVADELVFGAKENAHFRKRCAFFRAALIERDLGATPESEVIWLAATDALVRLSHASQRWAIERSGLLP